MLYAANALVVAKFTTTLVNAQITALNTALSTTADAVESVVDGQVDAPMDAAAFPVLAYYLGEDGGRSELQFAGKRDTAIALRLLYLSRHTTLATAKADVMVALEALQKVLESLVGAQHGATARYCVNVTDIALEFVAYRINEETMRHGGEVRGVMLMRTEGVT